MKYKIYTLGCKVNTYETNVMMDILNSRGFILDKEKPDYIIINTCTVTNTADRKSMKMIHHALKEGAKVIVVGCMSQMRSEEVSQIPGVVIVLGNKYKSKIADLINEYEVTKKQIVLVEDVMDIPFESMKLDNFNRTRAFVKIQDGCDNFCSYCIIPYTRGNIRSKDPIDVIDEVKTLIKKGHKEIVLTGIHTGHYGADLNNYTFTDLLKSILLVEGIERLRISSIEMNEITDEMIDLMGDNKVLVDHMHIPLQSGADKTLKDMNRKYNKDDFKKKITDIRKVRPNMSITTDLIVGYPTETEDDFNETLDTIKEINFSKVHVFPYSERKGTKSSELKDMNGLIKKKRVQEVLKLSKELEINYMKKFINAKMTFIPEVYKDGYLIGHTGNYLLVKTQGSEEDLYKEVAIKIKDIAYPYVIGEIEVVVHS